MQETFIRALGRIDAFIPVGPGAFQRYLRTALRNLVRDKVRRAGRRPPAEPIGDVTDKRPSATDKAAAKETLKRYRDALGRLGAVDRALVAARLEREWDFEKIARAFDKPTTHAARVAVGRAFDRLAKEMGIELSPRRRRTTG